MPNDLSVLDAEWTEADYARIIKEDSDLSFEEIAKVFGCSENKIKTIYQSAIDKLRESPEAIEIFSQYLEHRNK